MFKNRVVGARLGLRTHAGVNQNFPATGRSPCAHYKNRAAVMSMTGNFVDGQNAGFTLGSRLKDIASNPSKYYFNFHSIASWTHWQFEGKGPVGLCRGVMQMSQRRLGSVLV